METFEKLITSSVRGPLWLKKLLMAKVDGGSGWPLRLLTEQSKEYGPIDYQRSTGRQVR